jgi:hypothetical protein
LRKFGGRISARKNRCKNSAKEFQRKKVGCRKFGGRISAEKIVTEIQRKNFSGKNRAEFGERISAEKIVRNSAEEFQRKKKSLQKFGAKKKIQCKTKIPLNCKENPFEL